MIKYYIENLKKSFDFKTKTSRRSFWFFILANFIISIVLGLLFLGSFVLGGGQTLISTIMGTILVAYNIALTIPYLASGTRRLHDAGRSGLWLIPVLIPIVNSIYVLFPLTYFWCQPSEDTTDENESLHPFDNADYKEKQTESFIDENKINDNTHIEQSSLSENSKSIESPFEQNKEKNENKAAKQARPENLIVGYLEDITRKGLKDYIIGQTYKYFPSPHYTVFKIEKYRNGFIYEIHDGGDKLTHLKAIKKEFENGEQSIVIKTVSNYVKVSKNHLRIECMILEEDDDLDAKIIDDFHTSKMEEAVPMGAGVFLSGLMFISFGIITLFFSVLFKYSLFPQNNEMDNELSLDEFPHEYYERLPRSNERRYVKKMFLNQEMEWDREIESLTPEQYEREHNQNERAQEQEVENDVINDLEQDAYEAFDDDSHIEEEDTEREPRRERTRSSTINMSDLAVRPDDREVDAEEQEERNDVDEIFQSNHNATDEREEEELEIENIEIDENEVDASVLENQPY